MGRTNSNRINSSRKNTSKKKKINLFSYYSKNFKNTTNIPVTNIINYMKKNFNAYDNERIQKEKENKYIIDLDDCFDFKGALTPGLRQFAFDSPIDSKQDFSLDKLISYAFYSKLRSTFIDPDTKEPTNKVEYLDRLKFQIGKDIRRLDSTINSKSYPASLYNDQTKNNYDIADIYYQTLIDYFYKIKNINFDIINKIALLSCQNIFNLISDLITIKINYLLNPQMNTVTDVSKSVNIIIEKDVKTMQFNFDSQLIISRDWENGEGIDPEYPCGVLAFKFLIDFTNNTFKFNEFKLEYNLDNCGPPINNGMNNTNNTNNNSNNSNGNLKYAIPAALGVGAIIATPFLLGALGGKKNNKTKIYKKHKNYKNYKNYKKHNKTKKY